jgi:hypothetical protein
MAWFFCILIVRVHSPLEVRAAPTVFAVRAGVAT